MIAVCISSLLMDHLFICEKCFWHMSISAPGFEKHISNILKNLKLNTHINPNLPNAR
jgi:hypothetical protein